MGITMICCGFDGIHDDLVGSAMDFMGDGELASD